MKEYKNTNMIRNVKDYKRWTMICDSSWERLLKIKDMYSDRLAYNDKDEYNMRRSDIQGKYHGELKGKDYMLYLKMTTEERRQMVKNLGLKQVKNSRGRYFYIV